MKHKIKVCPITMLILWYFSHDLVDPVLSRLIGSVASEILFGITLIMLLFSVYLKNPKSIKVDSYILIGACFFIFQITMLLHPEYKTMMLQGTFDIYGNVFSLHRGIILYLIIRIESDPNALLKNLKLAAIPVWLAYTIKSVDGVQWQSVSIYSGNIKVANYNHMFGFNFLFVALIFTFFFLKEKKFKYIVLATLSLIQIIMYASRTAILSYLIFVILYIIFFDKNRSKNKRIITLSVVFFGFLLLTSSSFIRWIGLITSKFGLSSKILNSFVQNDFSLDGGRVYLYTQGIKIIKENPWGIGVFGDRYHLNVYVHNIALELLIDFGWILGAIIIISLIIIFIKLFKCKNADWKVLFLLFFSLSMIRLVVSYSFWTESNFWGMLGVCHSALEQKKNKS